MRIAHLTAIIEALAHLVTNDTSLQEVLREINQFAIALIPAEACTTWIRAGEELIVCRDTAYPLSRTHPVSGMALTMRDGQGVGLTAYMAYQFTHAPERSPIFNLSQARIREHPAYGGGQPLHPYFPKSTTSLSILCAPIRAKTSKDLLGLVKVENQLSAEGGISGESFSDEEAEVLEAYAGLLGIVTK
jgi:GAF domain-containing protein